MIFRPTKFVVSSSLAQPADKWTADVPGTDFFRGASEDDRVTLVARYDLDGEPQEVTLVDEGVIDFYWLNADVKKIDEQIEGRDQMAHLMDFQYNLVYRNGPPPEVTDGQITIPELAGLFAASEIARQIAFAAGLTLVWECPDYLIHDMFQAVGKPIDLLQTLVSPFCLVEARKVDVFTMGSTVYCRQRVLSPTVSAQNTFSLHDARIKRLKIRKFQTDKIGLVSLTGMQLPGSGDGSGSGQVPFLTWLVPAPVTWPEPVSDGMLNATANVPGEFSYSPQAGESLEPGSQTLNADFEPTDTDSYKSGSISVTLVVNQIVSLVVWANPADVVENSVLSEVQLNATAVDPDNFPIDGVFTYSPPDGTILTAGTKTLQVTFTPLDSAHYSIETGDATLVVTGTPPPFTPVITWADPADMVYGEALSATQLNATADVDGIFDYSPADGVVLSSGIKTLKVHFTPDDSAYEDTTAEVSVRVTRAAVSWPRPPDMVVGDALSGAQLNATANVPGAFEYDPPDGTVMSEIGSFKLGVTFTPTASGPQSVSASATLRVVDPSGGNGTGTTVQESSTVAFDARGNPISAVHVTSTYRMPGSILIKEVKLSYTADPGGQGFASGPLNLEFTDTKTLTYEDSVLTDAGVSQNQPRQLGEESTRVRTLRNTGTPWPVAHSTMVYVYDDPLVDSRGLLALTVFSEDEASGNAVEFGSGPAAGGPGAFIPGGGGVFLPPLLPKRITKKFYKDHTQDFYVVSTDVQEWSPSNSLNFASGTSFAGFLGQSNAGGWSTVSHDEAATSGTRPGGINSGGGIAPQGVEGDLPSLNWTVPSDITYPAPLTEDQLNATADVDGNFVYSPGVGVVLAPRNQTLLATFTPSDPSYKVATVAVTISVAAGTPVITWADPADIVEGTPLDETQLNATADVPGIFTYNPPSGRILKANSYTLKVTFTPQDSNYETVTAEASLFVTGTPAAGDPLITWPSPDSINEGVQLSAVQLNATADVDGVFAYSPATGASLSAGTHTLHVTFTPDDEVAYKTVSTSVTITVTKIQLSWGKPPDTAVGTALDEVQLNATANVDGLFEYNPPAGTVVGVVGTLTLNATFTPTGGGTVVAKSVTLNVVATDGSGATGPYVTAQRVIDPSSTAVPLDLSDSNLDQETIDLIMSQVAECSGLWQWELSPSGSGIPWLRRADPLQFIDILDGEGEDVPTPPVVIQTVQLTYDEVGSKSVTRETKAIAWTPGPTP